MRYTPGRFGSDAVYSLWSNAVSFILQESSSEPAACAPYNPASLQARVTTFLNIGTVNTFVEVL
jgi:hypothetical protein